MFYGVLTSAPDDPALYLARTSAAASFLADYDGSISRAYGAADMPRTIVLDPMLRAIADIPGTIRPGTAKPYANCWRACLRSTIQPACR